METIADAYAYYVFIIGVSEQLFWDADISMLKDIAENKHAYEEWLSYKREELRKKK